MWEAHVSLALERVFTSLWEGISNGESDHTSRRELEAVGQAIASVYANGQPGEVQVEVTRAPDTYTNSLFNWIHAVLLAERGTSAYMYTHQL